MNRISKFLLAEDRPPAYAFDLVGEGEVGKNAIECEGDFVWDVVTGSDKAEIVKEVKDAKPEDVVKGYKKPKKEKEKVQVQEKDGQSDKRDSDSLLPTFINPSSIGQQADAEAEEQPFQLKNLKLAIPKGAFVAIVGRVGSGKVSSNI